MNPQYFKFGEYILKVDDYGFILIREGAKDKRFTSTALLSLVVEKDKSYLYKLDQTFKFGKQPKKLDHE